MTKRQLPWLFGLIADLKTQEFPELDSLIYGLVLADRLALSVELLVS